MPRTLYRKFVDSHTVRPLEGGEVLLGIDLHIMNEYTSPQAFSGLAEAGRAVFSPGAHLAVVDHVNSTRRSAAGDAEGALLIETLEANCRAHGIAVYGVADPRQGIEHVVVPEQGLARPGMVIACGDSHTTTYGAFGALGFSIGTSEVEHVLATQTLVYAPLKDFRIVVEGALPPGATAKDVAIAAVAAVGAGGANGYAVEFAGSAIAGLDLAGRMTVCNMAVELGARAALIAPDDTVFAWLRGRPQAPEGAAFDAAVAAWRGLASDADAVFDRELRLDAGEIPPLVTWGTSPDQAAPITGRVPDPAAEADLARRAAAERALAYMGLAPGQALAEVPIDRAFIGSCTNSRIEDLRAAAAVLRGRRVAPGVVAVVVPGSNRVRAEAEAEGLDQVFRDAGFAWRPASGCSMCLAMNDDVARPGERLASSTNRNFEGRQGRGARTHLMSPAMVAAAAVAGRLADVRDYRE